MSGMTEHQENRKLITDFCNKSDYKSSVHHLKMIGELHGTNTMLLYVVLITASLDFEHQMGLAEQFRSQII